MLWLIVGTALVVLLGVWFLLPTVQAVVRSDFDPVSKDDESVFRAQSAGVEHAGI